MTYVFTGPIWDEEGSHCPAGEFRRLHRYHHNPGHGDVCRHRDYKHGYLNNLNWECPKACTKTIGYGPVPPFCHTPHNKDEPCRV